MSSAYLLNPTRGVSITQLNESVSHPLDEFVPGVRTRSEEAFRQVYETTVDDLVSFAYGMLSDRRTAEDVVQQAFVELVKAAPKIKGDGRSLRAWLYRSVRFGCMDEYRRRSRRPEIPHETLPDEGIDHDPMEHRLEPSVEAALGSLSKRHRTVVILRHVVGMSGEEIAEVIGTSTRAAYAVVSRAEANLRKALEAGDE